MHYGKNAVEFELMEADTKFCKIEIGEGTIYATFTPVMKEPAVTEEELAKLCFYKNFQMNRKVE